MDHQAPQSLLGFSWGWCLLTAWARYWLGGVGVVVGVGGCVDDGGVVVAMVVVVMVVRFCIGFV